MMSIASNTVPKNANIVWGVRTDDASNLTQLRPSIWNVNAKANAQTRRVAQTNAGFAFDTHNIPVYRESRLDCHT
jgi:hypothetical protein